MADLFQQLLMERGELAAQALARLPEDYLAPPAWDRPATATSPSDRARPLPVPSGDGPR